MKNSIYWYSRCWFAKCDAACRLPHHCIHNAQAYIFAIHYVDSKMCMYSTRYVSEKTWGSKRVMDRIKRASAIVSTVYFSFLPGYSSLCSVVSMDVFVSSLMLRIICVTKGPIAVQTDVWKSSTPQPLVSPPDDFYYFIETSSIVLSVNVRKLTFSKICHARVFAALHHHVISN